MADLLGPAEVPPGFAYPPEFLRVVELGLVNLEPWWIFDGAPLRDRVAGLRVRFPDRVLVPFARREDNDDVACWESAPPRVVVIHDFASPGFENRGGFADFNGWLRQAIEDLIAFA
jgi:hypothetical protein